MEAHQPFLEARRGPIPGPRAASDGDRRRRSLLLLKQSLQRAPQPEPHARQPPPKTLELHRQPQEPADGGLKDVRHPADGGLDEPEGERESQGHLSSLSHRPLRAKSGPPTLRLRLAICDLKLGTLVSTQICTKVAIAN